VSYAFSERFGLAVGIPFVSASWSIPSPSFGADQYLVRGGGAIAIAKGFAFQGAYRIEGQRRYDLLGKSHGFRRPGVAMFAEPGISYSNGRQTISLNVPIAFYRNRKPDPYTGLQGDATFPRYIMLGSYGFRFGGKRGAQATPIVPCP